MEEQDEDFLYGDLADIAAEAEIERLKQKLGESDKEKDVLAVEIAQLKQQLQTLIEDKEILEKNIVTIYNTATREIRRKDNELASLRQQVIALQTGRR